MAVGDVEADMAADADVADADADGSAAAAAWSLADAGGDDDLVFPILTGGLLAVFPCIACCGGVNCGNMADA